MKVRLVGPAFAQLGVILSDLAVKNPSAAKRFVARVDDVIACVSQFPDAFQEVEDRPGVRRVPLLNYPYLLFYRVVGDEVVVVAIVHGARKEPWENL
ncbi:MAG TPA: type II toxin-antitoxin system RelE/ParE family toxin [Pseudolabrys sp.]|nr:type II toxin-antitoxin system RelE/ParE family toxin [Pseudolabrys sp.]